MTREALIPLSVGFSTNSLSDFMILWKKHYLDKNWAFKA